MSNLVKISSFCETNSGGTPSRDKANLYYGGEIPWVKSGELRENFITDTEEKITALALQESAAKLNPANSILLAMYGATVGRMAILGIEAATNQAVCAINPDPQKADLRFVFHALQRQVPEFLLRAKGGAQPNISQGMIRDTEIFLPPLREQKRIAAILDKAESLRRKRQQAIRLADDFLRAVFIDMFGDPVTNPKGWPVGTIRELVASANYGTSEKADDTEGRYPILRMNNLTYEGRLNLTSLKYVDLDEKVAGKYLARKGDLLFNRTNSKELVGKTAVYDRDETMAIAGYLIRVRMNEKGNPHYVSAYLNSTHGKVTLQAMCKSIVGMANINAQEMQNIRVMLPPIDLQDRYANVVEKMRATEQTFSYSGEVCEKLIAALSTKLLS